MISLLNDNLAVVLMVNSSRVWSIRMTSAGFFLALKVRIFLAKAAAMKYLSFFVVAMPLAWGRSREGHG